jgi:hypothetical protein
MPSRILRTRGCGLAAVNRPQLGQYDSISFWATGCCLRTTALEGFFFKPNTLWIAPI